MADAAKVPVSVLVPVKNEAHQLARCLASVRWAAEIWVVDSQSTDGTATIAEAHGAKVVQFAFNGTWPKKKNWALATLPWAHEWVFILDADEVLPPAAEAELRAITSDAHHAIDGYWINRRFFFMGRWLRHAYYPNWNLRLFRHVRGRFEQITDARTASGDNEVHEHVRIAGPTARLRCEIDHYAFPTIEVFVEKHNRYSNWEARVALAGGGPRGGWRRFARWLPCRPWLRFAYVYFFQLGLLDGRAGFYFARLHAMYETLSVMKTHELRLAATRGETTHE
jgi:glycosyltransferase involved in cell wall biosynthesis